MPSKKIQILGSMTSGTVRHDVVQELTEAEKLQARENINAASLDENGKIPIEQLPDDIGSGGGGGAQVQADFAQNDDTQPDYIKNRIAYTDGVKDVEVFNQTLTCEYNPDMGMYMSYTTGLTDEFMNIYNNLGDIIVSYDGTEYNLGKYFYEGISFYGNPVIVGLEATEEPFVFYAANESGENLMNFVSLTDPAPDDPDNAPTIDHTVVISYQEEDVYTNPKYFNIDNILTGGKGDILWGKKNYIFEVMPDEGMGAIELEGYRYLPPNKNVKVYWDGVEYICKAQEIPDSGGMIVVGNLGLMTGETPTGEPFIIGTNNSELYIIYSLDTNPMHEMYIIADDEYKKKIDSEHLNINLNYDDQPESGSENLLTSDAIYRALGWRSSISVDISVNSNSSNPVSSQAVYNALGGREMLSIDTSVSQYSDSLVTSRAVYNAIENNKITVDSSVSIGSNNPVSGQAVYNALSNKQDKLIIDSSVNSGSNNPVSGQAVYNALQNNLSSKQDKISVTTSDNGKFMRVVNGAWAAVTIPNIEEGEF